MVLNLAARRGELGSRGSELQWIDSLRAGVVLWISPRITLRIRLRSGFSWFGGEHCADRIRLAVYKLILLSQKCLRRNNRMLSVPILVLCALRTRRNTLHPVRQAASKVSERFKSTTQFNPFANSSSSKIRAQDRCARKLSHQNLLKHTHINISHSPPAALAFSGPCTAIRLPFLTSVSGHAVAAGCRIHPFMVHYRPDWTGGGDGDGGRGRGRGRGGTGRDGRRSAAPPTIDSGRGIAAGGFIRPRGPRDQSQIRPAASDGHR